MKITEKKGILSHPRFYHRNGENTSFFTRESGEKKGENERKKKFPQGRASGLGKSKNFLSLCYRKTEKRRKRKKEGRTENTGNTKVFRNLALFFSYYYYTISQGKNLPNLFPTLRGCPRRQFVHSAMGVVTSLTRSVRSIFLFLILRSAFAGNPSKQPVIARSKATWQSPGRRGRRPLQGGFPRVLRFLLR